MRNFHKHSSQRYRWCYSEAWSVLSAMRVFHSDAYPLDLPEGHRFPIDKYGLLRTALVQRGILDEVDLVETPLATYEQLCAVHSRAYVDSIYEGTLDARAQRRIGLPWSKQLVNRCLASVGATVAASKAAMQMGVSGALSGGTHHSFADRGEGFCVFNDIAVSIRHLQEVGLIKRAMVVDLDVHQGNGTASIFREDENVFTFSVHGAKNFPFKKEVSNLDIALPDGVGDEEYLSALAEVWPELLTSFQCDIVFYLAGVDVLEKDSFGRLKLTHAGIRKRDEMVAQAVYERKIPMVLTLGGGYSKPIERSVEAYVGTYETVKSVYGDDW